MPRNHEKHIFDHQSWLPQTLSHTHSANEWFHNDGQLLFDFSLENWYFMKRFYGALLLFLCSAKPLLFWIIWEWTILDEHIFWVPGVVWFPRTPSNSHPKTKNSPFCWLSFGVHFSDFARTGSQVPAASQLVLAFWPITQPSQPTYQGQPQVLVCCWMLQACFFTQKTFLCPSEDLGLVQALTGTKGSFENAGFTYSNHPY